MYKLKISRHGYEIVNSRTDKGLATSANILDALHYVRICNREERNNGRNQMDAARTYAG